MLAHPLPRLVLFFSLAVVFAACGDSDDDASTATIAPDAADTTTLLEFGYTFDLSTETGVWIATGEAIDDGLLCPRATTVDGEFEDENGNVRTFEDVDALHRGSERFVSVDARHMKCDDGSGDFTLRLINEVDPANPDRHGIVATTWTIAGGTGRDDLHGSGDCSLPEFLETSMELTASGSVTTN